MGCVSGKMRAVQRAQHCSTANLSGSKLALATRIAANVPRRKQHCCIIRERGPVSSW